MVVDTPVIDMGPRDVVVTKVDPFDDFKKLALVARDNPNSRPTANAKMAALLLKMSPADRDTLRTALANAGVKR